MLAKLEASGPGIISINHRQANVKHYYKTFAIEQLILVSILNQVTTVLLYCNRVF